MLKSDGDNTVNNHGSCTIGNDTLNNPGRFTVSKIGTFASCPIFNSIIGHGHMLLYESDID